MPVIHAPTVSPKFRELLIYVALASASDPKFGSVKLNKILYYADFAAYRLLGASISGDEYQNLPEGPAPRHLLTARESLESDGSAHIQAVPYFNKKQLRLVADRQPTPGVLSDKEIGIVDEVIAALREYDGRQVTDLSHGEFGWKLTRIGETIPYYTTWVSADPLNHEQIAKGFEVAQRHGLIPATSAR